MSQDKKPLAPKLDYPVYLDHRKILIELENEQSQRFDLRILSLAAGAFALSVIFLQGENSPTNLDILLASWVLLGTTILSTMTSFLVCQEGMKHKRKLLDDEQKGEGNQDGKEGHWSTGWSTRLTWLSFVTFTVGTIALAGFIYFNAG